MSETTPTVLTYDQLDDMVERIKKIPPIIRDRDPGITTKANYLGQRCVNTVTGKQFYCKEIPENGVAEFKWEEIGDASIDYVDARILQNAGAPTTATAGAVGQLLEDTTNAKLYQCTAVNSSMGVDTTAGLTSQISGITFTISDLSKLNSKISDAATLSAGSYMVRKGAGLAYYISNINDSTSLGSLGNIVPTAFANALGVTPAPANIWSQAASHLANGAPVFSFTLINGGQVTYSWAEVGGGPTVVQTTGTSTTDVMSQDATTKMIWQNVAAGQKVIRIGNYDTDDYAFNSVNIGAQYTRSGDSVAIGASSAIYGSSDGSVVVGSYAHTPISGAAGSVVIGYMSGDNIDHAGMVDVGSTNSSYGYDSNSNYRVITGVHDAQNAHDAVTLGQLNTLITQLQNLGLNVSLQGAANNDNQNSGSSEDPGMEEPDPGVAEPTVTCPFCGMQTSADSTICQFCGNDISGGAMPDPEEPIAPEEPTEEPVEG